MFANIEIMLKNSDKEKGSIAPKKFFDIHELKTLDQDNKYYHINGCELDIE